MSAGRLVRRRSLAVRIVLLSAAAVIFPALLISVFNREVSSRALQSSIQKHQTELARRIAEEINSEILRAQSLVALVARSSYFSAGSRVDQYEALHNLLNAVPALQEAMFVSDDGTELVKIAQSGSPARLLRRRAPSDKSQIGSPFFSGNRAPTVLINEPVRNFANPTRRGTVMAKLSFMTLDELLRQAQIGSRGVAFIVDDRGTLIAHPDPQLVYSHPSLGQLPVVKSWAANPEQPTGLIEYTDSNGQTVVGLAYPVPSFRSAVIVQQPKSDVYAPLHRMRNQFIVASAISVSVVLFVAVAIALKIMRPLQELRQAAERVGRGETDVHLQIHTGGDEVEDLGHSFTQMVKSLSELERMRSDLISMIVHDLKMPLATIIPSLDALISGEPGSVTGQQKDFVVIARRASQEMLMMIQNLLDVAKMEEGKLALHMEAFLPKDWASSVIANFRPLADASHKHMELVVERFLPSAYGDVPLLSRVLGNLVSNALRHTPAGSGEVVVSLYRDGSQLAVEVRDNGEGIPEEDQKHVFEKYVQGGPKRATLRTGTGLGLTFCKMVVEAHEGRIHLYSQPQAGSLFTFHLPIPEDALKAATDLAQEQDPGETPSTPTTA